MIPPRPGKPFPWKPYLGAVYSLTVAVSLGILVANWWPELIQETEPEPEPRLAEATAPPAEGPPQAKPTATPTALARAAAPPARRAFLPAPINPLRQAPAWRRFAAAGPAMARGDAPLVAIVLDDAGINRPNTRRALTMKAPLTFAFLPYAKNLAPLVARARANGHEILVHLPMEPLNAADYDTGPNALMVGLSEPELRRRLNWNLSRFQGYVGVNNHMGSRFTADAGVMAKVLGELKNRGLLFLDSRTTNKSVGAELAEEMGVPGTSRDVFIDNERSAANIAGQLVLLRRVAEKHGSAIGIGHLHARTLEALEIWVEEIEAEGLVLAPVSAVVARRLRERGGAAAKYAGH